VQIIGNFVSRYSIDRRLNFVDGSVKIIQFDRSQLFGKSLLQTRVEKVPETSASADQVFPQAGLAFVDPGRSAGGQRGSFEAFVDVLFVHAVAGFVESTEQGVGKILVAVAGGDGDVVDGKSDSERMMSFIESAAVEVVTKTTDDIPVELTLQVDSEVVFKAGVVCRRYLGDGLNQRNQFFTQIGENLAQGLGFHTVISKIDQRIGDVLVTGEKIGQLLTKLQGFF